MFAVQHSFYFSIFKTISAISPFLCNPLLHVHAIISMSSAHLFTSQTLLGNPFSMLPTFGSIQQTVGLSATLSLCNCACDYW